MLQGDLSQSNLYREEAVEAITESLECHNCSTKVQEQSAKALLMFGGCFSYSGEVLAEEWLLRQAGFHERLRGSFQRKEIVDGNLVSFNIASYQQNEFTFRKDFILKHKGGEVSLVLQFLFCNVSLTNEEEATVC